MIPSTREEFKQYCLRAVGDGVLQVNCTDDQIEDRIDEGIYMFSQFHMDAVERTFVAHQITPSTMVCNTVQGTLNINTRIVGSTSLVNAFIYNTPVSNATHTTFNYVSVDPSKTRQFLPGELIVSETDTTTNTTPNAVCQSITLGDYDNGYIIVPHDIIGVNRVFAPYDSRISADILFDPQSQFNMSLLANFTSSSVIPYYIGRSYQQLLNDMFRGRPGIRFNRHTNRVYLDFKLAANLPPGYYVIVEATAMLDKDAYPLVWGDRWLARYCIALIKRQWATNLSKYNGISLPGGVTLDGQSMYTSASQELRDLEQELRDTYMEPPGFIVG